MTKYLMPLAVLAMAALLASCVGCGVHDFLWGVTLIALVVAFHPRVSILRTKLLTSTLFLAILTLAAS